MDSTKASNAYQYDAFISYSTEDGAFAKSLERALESYKPPAGLDLPQRHLNIFRYEGDMTGTEYHEAIDKHLKSSAKLVLVCSPNARKSRYVDGEIRRFRELNNPNNIIPIIVAGIPNNEAADDQEEEKAFPQALCEALEMPLAISYAGTNLKREKLNKGIFEGSWYTLLANIFEISRDDIERRDKKRQLQRRRLLSAVAISVITVLSVSTGIAVWQRGIAIAERKEAEEQRQIAVARQLAAQAESIRHQHNGSLQRSVLLATESMLRFPSLEADQALRHGLALLPRLVRRLDHEEQHTVNDLVFSWHGKYLATTVREGEAVQVWEPTTGRETVRINPEDTVFFVAFSSDEKYLVTESEADTARVWEVPTGEEVDHMRHEGSVSFMVMGLDGQYAERKIRGSKDAWTWETTSGQEVTRITYPSEAPFGFSRDGKYFATASNDGTVRIRRATTGKQVAHMKHKGRVSFAAFSSDGKHLVTKVREGKAVRVWEAMTGREVTQIKHQDEVMSVALSPDGKCLATAVRWDRAARVWDVTTGQELARMDYNEVFVTRVTFSPDGKYLATASGRSAWVWEVGTTEEVARMIHDNDIVSSVHFSADGKYLATASYDHTARVWEVPNGKEVARMIHDNLVRSADFSPDGKYLITVTSLSDVSRIWEVTSARETCLPMKHERSVMSVAISPTGTHAATAEWGTVRLWEVPGGQEITSMKHESPSSFYYVPSIAFSPDGRYLATASTGNTARMWEIPSGMKVGCDMVHRDEIKCIAFSPDGRYVATASSDDTARVWEATTGNEVVRMNHKGSVSLVTFSPDGKRLATAASSIKTASVWEIGSGQEVAQMKCESWIDSIAFSPDGMYLATAGNGGMASRVWDSTTGQEFARMSHKGYVTSVAFSPDGKYLASASVDRSARIWYWRPEDLIAEAHSRLSRNLTYQEWQQYLGEEPYRKTCPNLPIDPSFIEAGRDLARKGDVKGAIAIFRRAKELEPTLDLDPEAEAHRLASPSDR